MSNIADKLNYLNDTKKAIKTSIKNRGVDVSDDDTFRSYADKIDNIGETINKTKFGVSIDSMLGDVDENGNYIRPSTSDIIDLSGVINVASGQLEYAFYKRNVKKVIANDIKNVSDSSFSSAFAFCNTEEAYFNGLEEINNVIRAFANCFERSNSIKLQFSNLRKISGTQIFKDFAPGANIEVADAFPSLEEISGNLCFSGFCSGNGQNIIRFPLVKKIIGGPNTYDATFLVSCAMRDIFVVIFFMIWVLKKFISQLQINH